ncbi:mitochondrial single stranded DNA-binding protein isoform X2 [Lycorma delicatula]|uniref:mitochondrial single stranded DNA-binding protein isoform X2 n=1 Tax=Lycorma delicatula TaxID=130591 RepID=UPI003F5195F4
MNSTKNLLTRSILSVIRSPRLYFSNTDSLPKTEKSLNSVTLLGRVGGEPQKRGSDEHPVVIFSLATNTNYRYESGDFTQKTEWHRICIFKPSLRDTVYNYLRKGQRVYVSGRISYGEIKDDHGNTRPATSIIADDIIFFQSN